MDGGDKRECCSSTRHSAERSRNAAQHKRHCGEGVRMLKTQLQICSCPPDTDKTDKSLNNNVTHLNMKSRLAPPAESPAKRMLLVSPTSPRFATT